MPLQFVAQGPMLLPAASGDSVAATNFLARTALTSPTDDTYINAYKTLLNGLTTDAIFAANGTSTKLDFLYTFCTKDQTLSRLNLVKNLFNSTINGSPVFVTNAGWTGTTGADYINAGFNPSTAGGNYAQNSAHVAVWANADTTAATAAIGQYDGSVQTDILPHNTGDNLAYYRINDSTGSAGVTGNGPGYFVATRSGASTQNGYRNAVDQSITPVTSGALINNNMMAIGFNSNGSLQGYPGEISISHAGSSLTATDVSNLYSRLGTFRTTMGL